MSSKLDINKVFAKYSEKCSRVVCGVHDFQTMTPTVAKVVMTFNTRERTAQESANAIGAAFDNHVIAIEGSFRGLKVNPLAAVGFIRSNREVREYKIEDSPKYKTMASNLLMDPEDQSLWEVKSSQNGNKYIIRQDNEDLSDLLKTTASTRSKHTPTLTALASAMVSPNEYVAFVNPRLEEMAFGYVVGDKDEENVEIAAREGSLVVNETIDREMIVESAFLNGSDRFKSVAAPTSESMNNKSAMLAYYRQMFSYSPEYYQKLEAIINSHAVF